VLEPYHRASLRATQRARKLLLLSCASWHIEQESGGIAKNHFENSDSFRDDSYPLTLEWPNLSGVLA